jgi:predicted nucleotidyltransferase
MLTIEHIKTAASKLADGYPIKKISLFGSYAEGSADESSDVDLLVEFLTPRVSLFTLSDIKYAMEDELKKDVDIVHAPVLEESLLKFNKVIDIYEH